MFNIQGHIDFKVLIVAKCIVNFGITISIACIEDSINSSKVYCKCINAVFEYSPVICINSSKVYCKYINYKDNFRGNRGINSSKVYCK